MERYDPMDGWSHHLVKYWTGDWFAGQMQDFAERIMLPSPMPVLRSGVWYDENGFAVSVGDEKQVRASEAAKRERMATCRPMPIWC